MNREYSHCPDCGAELPAGGWPKRCPSCEAPQFLNPIPVAVLLQPVDEGVLTVRRAIAPHEGELALPGGFIDLEEGWREAAVRELREETGLEAEPGRVEVFDVKSAPDGTLLVFGRAPSKESGALDAADLGREVEELVVVREPRQLAFPLHTDVVEAWFARQAIVAG